MSTTTEMKAWCDSVYGRLRSGDKQAVWELFTAADGHKSPFGRFVFRMAKTKANENYTLANDLYDNAVNTGTEICQRICNGRNKTVRDLKSYVIGAIKRKWRDFWLEETGPFRYPATSFARDKKAFDEEMTELYGDDPRRPVFQKPNGVSFDDKGYYGSRPSSSHCETLAWRKGSSQRDENDDARQVPSRSRHRIPPRIRGRCGDYNFVDAWLDDPVGTNLKEMFRDREYDVDEPEDLVGAIQAMYCETDEERYVFRLCSAGYSYRVVSEYSPWGTSKSKAQRIFANIIDRFATGKSFCKHPKTLSELLQENEMKVSLAEADAYRSIEEDFMTAI